MLTLCTSQPSAVWKLGANTMYHTFGKRSFDLFLALLSLPVLLPVMVVLALLIRWKLGKPVLFQQVRPGWHGQPFTLYKFRTMTDARDAAGNLLPDSERLPPFGAFLRSTSLDELPELFNILKGEMSFVGPRPLLMEYLSHYTAEQARRHDVRPGLSGWAQVSGRNAIDWDQRFMLDVWYVEHQSLVLDLRILFRTIYKVLERDGISKPGQVTIQKFMGSAHS
jgi:sugar transferase EpsL